MDRGKHGRKLALLTDAAGAQPDSALLRQTLARLGTLGSRPSALSGTLDRGYAGARVLAVLVEAGGVG